MSRPTKIGNNEPCPCGSHKKYKHCCKGKVDWEALSQAGSTDYAKHLTLRGKNLLFLGAILEALQIDTLSPDIPFSQLKKAFTPKVVQQIHNGIADCWPDLEDYETCLAKETGAVTGLYTGTYEPASIFRAVTRHAIYSEKIYLVDPFLDPRRVTEEFNPIVHPEQHRTSAIKFSFLWLSLLPWIRSGIVSFVRPLQDFIPGLQHEILDIQRKKAESNPQLEKLLTESVEAECAARGPTDGGTTEYLFLSFPDAFYREHFHKLPADNPFKSEDEFLKYIQLRRDRHPFYVDHLPGQESELLHETSGANYELAKRMCALTKSHIITDMEYRWKELELDRPKASSGDEQWAPFAKALQNAELKVLSNVPISAALRLREENRLEPMRLFFRKVWKSCREPDQFSKENATNLAAELNDKIGEAEAEWRKIDQDLLKWFGAAGGPIVTAAFSGFVPAVAAAAGASLVGAAALIQSHLKHSQFQDRYPAGFFLGLKKPK
jgi:hypothetical protein